MRNSAHCVSEKRTIRQFPAGRSWAVIRILMEILLVFQKSNIFAESCLTECKAQNFTEVTLSLNRYQQFSTYLLNTVIQADTENFIIQDKNNQNGIYTLFETLSFNFRFNSIVKNHKKQGKEKR